jgi:hypothetical protein
MTTILRRKYSRHPDYVPIFYAGYNSKGYSKAIMHNSCLDGMYFESDSPLQPKFDLFIRVQTHPLKSFEPDPYRAFRARVKWCRQVSGGERPLYGTGVQFMAKSHLAYGINIRNSDHLCDFCEERVTERLIHQTETGLLLCPGCFSYMEALPGCIEEAIERFLLGNVV